MMNPSLSERDPRYHTQNVGRMTEELINHLREDVEKIDAIETRINGGASDGGGKIGEVH